jgi:hypothetical protein
MTAELIEVMDAIHILEWGPYFLAFVVGIFICTTNVKQAKKHKNGNATLAKKTEWPGDGYFNRTTVGKQASLHRKPYKQA